MSARRGACPTLAAPMRTGDGWLARLMLTGGLTPAQLGGLATAAGRHGNGRIEISARGSVQVRGLQGPDATALRADLAALGIAVPAGPPVLTGPLAGVDPVEIADPRPLAEAIRAGNVGLAGLHPKVSVVVDGGGSLHLDGVRADVRVRAVVAGRWVVGTEPPTGAGAAVNAAMQCLEALARNGGRGCEPARGAQAQAVGRVALGLRVAARGFGLGFGQVDATTLAAFAAVFPASVRLHPAAGRALVAVGLSPKSEAAAVRAAERLGLVVDPEDPRLSVVACAGAPSCASAHLDTQALAEAVAVARPDLLERGWRLHLSGCAKRCAQPAGPSVTLVAGPNGREILADGVAIGLSLRAMLMERVKA